ncbi:hypothetical protein C1H46_035562 [Malus baccata]|uniref:Uncharacterized protein n=1 Tax=Malus baccata TaxID=106549 RepID=A0A540KXB9_MALBA|nr:hypothetical protein C1H46_035562 [Malus baccata]
MALSMMHQTNTLSETPIKTTAASSTSVESVSASPISLVLWSSQPDLSMACKAFVTEAESPVLEHQVRGTHDKGTGVPVYVMMLFDSVMMHNSVNRKKGDECESAGAEERWGGGCDDGRVVRVGREKERRCWEGVRG